MHDITTHIVLYTIVGTTGLILALIRFLRNRNSKNTLNKTLYYLDANPINSWKMAEKLDCFIGRSNENRAMSTTVAIPYLRKHNQLGKYEIHRIIEVQKAYYLFVTTCTDHDFALGVGGMGTVKEVFQTNFALKINKVSQQEEMYAHQYANREEERLLKEFAKSFFALTYLYNIER